jgi:hypothetical protein
MNSSNQLSQREIRDIAFGAEKCDKSLLLMFAALINMRRIRGYPCDHG